MIDLADDILKHAPIIWDGDVGGRDGNPITVYRIKIENSWSWFKGQEKYEEKDGNKFTIIISSFGSFDKLATESTADNFRRKFDAALSDRIKRRVLDFFLGTEEKSFFPFTHPRARCIGVEFATDWILTT